MIGAQGRVVVLYESMTTAISDSTHRYCISHISDDPLTVRICMKVCVIFGT
jgi:hypothetical protein